MKKSVFNSIRKAAMVFAAFAVCSVFSTGAYAQFQQDDYSGGIDKGIEKIMNDLDVIGLGVAVVANGKIIYKNSWGYKNLETKTPLAEDDNSLHAAFTHIFHRRHAGLFQDGRAGSGKEP